MTTKKQSFLGLVLAAAILLPAGATMAAALVPGYGMMNTTRVQSGSGAVTISQDANAQKIEGYMEKLQNGQLTSDEQKDMYGLIKPSYPVMTFTSSVPALRNQQYGFNMMSAAPFGMMSGYGHQFVWYSLMCVITVVLVWVALLLTIAMLYKKIKQK
ncbi:MAG: hypothetical protein HY918_00855 [Candidatus Doudnabacteria bacterium]|nr:hypothetical protein [Candidatus Doudnabacteria bacterium]